MESEVNLALIGRFRLRKYIELRDFAGGAIAHRGRSLISTTALVFESYVRIVRVLYIKYAYVSRYATREWILTKFGKEL